MAPADEVGRETRVGRVLDEDVRTVTERGEARPPRGVVEIEDDAALSQVPKQEGERTVRSRNVAGEGCREPVGIGTRPLDPDHVGAEVGEHAAGERAAEIGQVDDTEMRERPGRHGPRVSKRTRGVDVRPAPGPNRASGNSHA